MVSIMRLFSCCSGRSADLDPSTGASNPSTSHRQSNATAPRRNDRVSPNTTEAAAGQAERQISSSSSGKKRSNTRSNSSQARSASNHNSPHSPSGHQTSHKSSHGSRSFPELLVSSPRHSPNSSMGSRRSPMGHSTALGLEYLSSGSAASTSPPSPSSSGDNLPGEEVEAAMKGRRPSVQHSTRSARTMTTESLPTLLSLGSSRHSPALDNPDHPQDLFGSGHDLNSTDTASAHSRSSSESIGPEALTGTVGGHFDLLPPLPSSLHGRKCLVLDLDETLVHSSFKYIPDADFVIPVDIEGMVHDVYVVKRPGVDEYLDIVCQLYEVVVFTASVAKYSDPLLDHLDPRGKVHHRLFRESCTNYGGNFVKNLALLGRPLEDVIIVDNSPASYVLQPQHAVPISSWFSDIHDNELLDMVPFLRDLALPSVPDVALVLDTSVQDNE